MLELKIRGRLMAGDVRGENQELLGCSSSERLKAEGWNLILMVCNDSWALD